MNEFTANSKFGNGERDEGTDVWMDRWIERLKHRGTDGREKDGWLDI